MQEKIRAQVKPNDEPEERGGGGFGVGQPGHIPGYDTDLEDDVPFVTCDPSLEYRVR
jgi:hypothetical protein